MFGDYMADDTVDQEEFFYQTSVTFDDTDLERVRLDADRLSTALRRYDREELSKRETRAGRNRTKLDVVFRTKKPVKKDDLLLGIRVSEQLSYLRRALQRFTRARYDFETVRVKAEELEKISAVVDVNLGMVSFINVEDIPRFRGKLTGSIYRSKFGW